MRRIVLGAILVTGAALRWHAPALAWENLQQGRMTGGGKFVCVDDSSVGDVTHGFELHCDKASPNNLEINWDTGEHFHLENLTMAECINDPAFSPDPPPAPFNTFMGMGTGKLDGVDGASIQFVLTDHGEPGTNDTITVQIKDPAGNIVLDCFTTKLIGGNHQAHKDNK
jgi:hypothetical protein